MQNDILLGNLNCLPDAIRKLLPDAGDGLYMPPTVQIAHSQKGWPVAHIQIEDRFIHTNSMVDPIYEAKRWAETLDYKDVMVSFIYGCGFGYPLLEYVRRKKPYTETIIFERNIDLFYAMLSRIDMRTLLRDPAIHFVIGDLQHMKPMFESLMTPEFLLRGTKPAAFFTWLAHRNEKESYLDIHEWVWDTLELSLSGVGNSVHDTLVGLYNSLDNTKKILESPNLFSFKNAFAGKPAFIVANGPSLDKNVDLLNEACGKSLILTAESALRPCLKRGICPDAICVTERTPNVYHIHFEHDSLPEKLVLIGLSLIDPRIPKTFPGPFVPVFRSGESTAAWIQKSISDDIEETVGLHGGGSSAHLAFEFALWVGANPIIFVGQDLAFGPNKTTHSKLSAYSEEYMADMVQLIQAQPSLTVPGIDGNPLLTTKIWFEFKTWFEQHIQLHPETRFIDATEGGAYIQGTELMALQDVIDTFCKETLGNTLYDCVVLSNREIENSESEKQKYNILLKEVSTIREKFNKLANEASEDIRNCKLVERACVLQKKFPETELPPFVEILFQKNTNAFRKFAVDEQVVPFTQQVIFAIHKQINDIGEVDTTDRLIEVTRLQRKMIEYLKKTCELVSKHFDLAEQRVRRLESLA